MLPRALKEDSTRLLVRAEMGLYFKTHLFDVHWGWSLLVHHVTTHYSTHSDSRGERTIGDYPPLQSGRWERTSWCVALLFSVCWCCSSCWKPTRLAFSSSSLEESSSASSCWLPTASSSCCCCCCWSAAWRRADRVATFCSISRNISCTLAWKTESELSSWFWKAEISSLKLWRSRWSMDM